MYEQCLVILHCKFEFLDFFWSDDEDINLLKIPISGYVVFLLPFMEKNLISNVHDIITLFSCLASFPGT